MVPESARAAAAGRTPPMTTATLETYEDRVILAQPRWPWRGVDWSLTLVGLLVYVYVITSYTVPIAQQAMIAALVGVVVQRGRFRMPRPLIWFGLFVLWCAVGLATTPYPVLVWPEVQILLKLWLIALVAANALRTRSDIRFFIIFSLACYALYPVRGSLVNYYVYGESLMGRAYWGKAAFSNPNDLAALTFLPLAMSVSLLFSESKRGWVRWAAVVGVGVLPFLILATQSRGAFLSLAVTIALIGVTQGRRLLRLYRAQRGVTRLVLSVGVILVVIKAAPHGLWDRVAGLKHATSTENLQAVDPEGSAEQRWEIWRVGTSIFAENPITGVGVGAYPLAHWRKMRNALLYTGEFKGTAVGYRDIHSMYLGLLAETGILGLLLFASVVISTVLIANRARRRCGRYLPRASFQLLCLEFGLLPFFLAGIFGSFERSPFLVLYLVVVWAAAEVTETELGALTRGRVSVQPRVYAGSAPAGALHEGRRGR
jgi:O-antigen ligase